MDYASATAEAVDRPYLARISDAADEAGRIGIYIENFLDRCRGTGVGEQKATLAPVPAGHFAQLDRLSENLTRLDKLARELQAIG